jgi:ectoine hydroxylase-related dioxygenase (phytanoyl-CoA dioxygenase family)
MMGDLYRRFVAHMIQQLYGDIEVYHQAVPTFRVQFPNNLGVAEMHTDGEYRHQDGELNFWVPLTPVWGSNTIWIERTRGSYRYQPWTLKPGQVLIFDSVNWRHGNIRNSTGRTRISFDFRVIPAEVFVDSGQVSINRGLRMSVGDYWKETV